MHRWLRLVAFVGLLETVAGCNGTSSPPAPIPSTPLAPSPAPVIATAPNATLVIEHASVIVYPLPTTATLGYTPRFQLRETTGNSGATIQNVFIGFNNGGDNTGPSCWRDPVRVPPGGTLNIFFSDEGLKWLSYCAPSSGGASATPTLRLVVTFTDDDGRSGTVEAIATVAN